MGLAAARVIAVSMYVLTIPAFIIVAHVVEMPRVSGLPEFFPWLLLGIAIAEYVASLLIEGFMLEEKRLRGQIDRMPGSTIGAAVARVAIVTASFGDSIAVFGLVIALLAPGTAQWYLFGLAALHGIHLQLRWDRYEEAARRASS